MQYGPLSPPGIDAQQTSATTNKLLISFRGDSFHLQQGIELLQQHKKDYGEIGNLHSFIAFFIFHASLGQQNMLS